MKKIYSLLALVMLACTTIWGVSAAVSRSEGNETVKMWNFSDWEAASYEETTTIDGLTLYATSGKGITIDGNKKTIDDVACTQRLKFGGKTGWEGTAPKERALAFDVTGPTKVEIALVSASNTGTGRFLTVYNKDNTVKLGDGVEAPVDAPAVATFNYEGTDSTTLIVGVDGGINIYFIRATTTVAGEENPGEENPGEENPGEDNPGEENPGEGENPGEETPAGEVVDDIVAAAFDISQTSKYEEKTNVTFTSSAVYSGYLAKNNADAIQLNNNKNGYGIVSTVSGGKLAKVEIEWNESTTAGRTLNVYGKNEPYEKPLDLYSDDTKGELIGTFVYGAGNDTIFTVNGDYHYVGFCSAKSAMYIASLKVTWEAGEAPALTVAKPVITPATTGIKIGDEITISCATEGAKIYYTTDGTEPTTASAEYTAPIVADWELMTENGNIVISAIAVLEDVTSAVVTKTYDIMPELTDLSAISDLEDGTEFVMGCDLTVAYSNGNYNYVTDGVYYALIFKNLGLELNPGDVLNGGWDAKMSIYNNLPEIVPAGEVTKSETTVDAPEPAWVEEPAMAAFLYSTSNINGYLALKGVTFTDEINAENTTVGTMGEGEDAVEITLYKRFVKETYEPGVYDVTGFVSIFKEQLQFFAISIEAAAPALDEIQSLTALSDFEEGQEFVMGCDLTVVVAGNFNLVTDGETNFGFASFEDQQFEVGDIIKGGYKACLYMSIICVEDLVEVEGKAEELPEPMVVEPEIARWFSYEWMYETLLDVELLDDLDEDNDAGVAYVGDMLFAVLDVNGVAFMNPVEAGKYNITGFWMPNFLEVENADLEDDEDPLDNMGNDMYVSELLFVPVKFEKIEEETMPEVEWLRQLNGLESEDLLEVKVLCDVTVVVAGKNVTLVTDGLSYYGMSLDQEVAEGDVIKGGFTGFLTGYGFMVFDDVEIAEEKGTVPEPVDVTAEDVLSSETPWNYCRLMNVDFGEEGFEGMAFITYGEEEIIILDYDEAFEAQKGGAYNVTGYWLAMGATSLGEGSMVFVPTHFDFLTSIVSIESAANDGAVYYNVNGQQVSEPKAGNVYIRVAGNKASKVIVK